MGRVLDSEATIFCAPIVSELWYNAFALEGTQSMHQTTPRSARPLQGSRSRGSSLGEDMREIWRPIPGYEGYEVSNFGNVRSYRLSGLNGGRRSVPVTINPWTKLSGHLSVSLRKKGNTHKKLVHRLVLLAFVGKCPCDMEAAHNNGIPYDNRLSNLRYDTRSGNIMDRVKHGGSNRGSRHVLSKLNEQDVLSIRKDARPQKKIAADYGVSQSRISSIKSKKVWAWLEDK